MLFVCLFRDMSHTRIVVKKGLMQNPYKVSLLAAYCTNHHAWLSCLLDEFSFSPSLFPLGLLSAELNQTFFIEYTWFRSVFLKVAYLLLREVTTGYNITKTNEIFIFFQNNPFGIMAKVLDCSLKVSSNFSHTMITFRPNPLRIGMNPLILLDTS